MVGGIFNWCPRYQGDGSINKQNKGGVDRVLIGDLNNIIYLFPIDETTNTPVNFQINKQDVTGDGKRRDEIYDRLSSQDKVPGRHRNSILVHTEAH